MQKIRELKITAAIKRTEIYTLQDQLLINQELNSADQSDFEKNDLLLGRNILGKHKPQGSGKCPAYH